ncbi:hypothetical protein [Wolbachia endosymbiont (group A) of Scambus nigricans]|uniref:hypothetical protein n=1 Tax=Wolbachia endosymbiont (group A) of Scambus nigricans TaxID=2954055 RepID=UPI00222F0A5C|nr:hypothetical protein [Wolbachia endosymbiont (group A) of Scambus nigricans]
MKEIDDIVSSIKNKDLLDHFDQFFTITEVSNKKNRSELMNLARAYIALFTIIRTDRNMLLACYSHKHISYRIRTIIRKAIR